MKIAICDDNSAYVKKIESVVRTTLAEKNIDARFDLISDSAQLHDSAETYDMAFLDIGMTPYNGLEIAARLKKRNRNIIIFFITSYDDYIDDAMDLHVFRYISKPLDARRLRAGVEKALKLIDRARTSFLVKESGKWGGELRKHFSKERCSQTAMPFFAVFELYFGLFLSPVQNQMHR